MQTIADFERTCILRACRKRFILALFLYIEPAFYVVSENLFCFAMYAITVEFKRGLILSIDHSESTYVSAAAHLKKDFLSVVVR